MIQRTESPLRDAIVVVLTKRPAISAREIARELSSTVGPIDKSVVNSCLYSHREAFFSEGTVPPVWYAIAATKPDVEAPAVPAISTASEPGPWAASLDLYPWQVRALDGWASSGYVGVIEAVTGAGKTRLALAAIEAEVRRGGRAVAIVPTTDLQNQWLAEIDSLLTRPSAHRATVGAMGGGRFETLQMVQVLVATVQSACQYPLGLSGDGLLIADEAHHYGAEVWSGALEEGFRRRLALTATYERDDDGLEAVLDPYFGSYRYRLGYEEALADDVIAHFKVAFVGVQFDPIELALYSEADDKARRKRSMLINTFGLTPEPFGVFMREVQRLAKSESEGARHAGLYLSAFSKRRKILAAASEKFERLVDIVPAIAAAESTILFSQTREAAERAVSVVEVAGVSGATLHAELESAERREVFDSFRDGGNRFIAAPKLLDEGVDVPDADLAIVLASSRSRRQMIQRLGRVIRKKSDGRLGRLAIFYVEGTSEDPENGAHEDFIQFVIDAADDVQVFDSVTDATKVVRFLNDWY